MTTLDSDSDRLAQAAHAELVATPAAASGAPADGSGATGTGAALSGTHGDAHACGTGHAETGDTAHTAHAAPAVADRREALIHYTVAFIGGFLGVFPVVSAAQAFGSAQTMNLIDSIVLAVGCDWQTMLWHVGGAALYALAVILATVLQRRTKRDVRLAALAVDAVAAFVMWRLPAAAQKMAHFPLILYLYPTFFAMPFQWCAFKGAYGFTSSTIFSSNNFRQFFSALTEVYINGDKRFSLKARFFGCTLLAFHAGVALSCLLLRSLGSAGILPALVPIAVAAVLIVRV